MKKVSLLFAIFLVTIFFTSMSLTTVHAADSTDACDSPSQQISITADPDNDGSLKFDKQELRVNKNTCVEITFYNKSPAVEHDVKVDADDASGFAGFTLSLLNNKDGVNGSDYKVVNIQTPDADVTLEYYCAITGHRDGGMYGDFIIGEGGSAPGFGLPLAIVSLLALVAIPQLRKRN